MLQVGCYTLQQNHRLAEERLQQEAVLSLGKCYPSLASGSRTLQQAPHSAATNAGPDSEGVNLFCVSEVSLDSILLLAPPPLRL